MNQLGFPGQNAKFERTLITLITRLDPKPLDHPKHPGPLYCGVFQFACYFSKSDLLISVYISMSWMKVERALKNGPKETLDLDMLSTYVMSGDICF